MPLYNRVLLYLSNDICSLGFSISLFSHKHSDSLIQPHTARSNSEAMKQRFCFLLIKTAGNRDNFIPAVPFLIEIHFYSQCLMWNCLSTKMKVHFIQSHVKGHKGCSELAQRLSQLYSTLNAISLILDSWKQWLNFHWPICGMD